MPSKYVARRRGLFFSKPVRPALPLIEVSADKNMADGTTGDKSGKLIALRPSKTDQSSGKKWGKITGRLRDLLGGMPQRLLTSIAEPNAIARSDCA